MLPWRHVLVATDFSQCSVSATNAAIEIAARFDAKLTIAHVLEISVYVYSGETFSAVDLISPIDDAARKSLAETLERVRKQVPNAQSVFLQGSPVQELVGLIRSAQPDLVVIGTHGRRGVSHFFLGSVAERLVQQSPVSVLTIHPENS